MATYDKDGVRQPSKHNPLNKALAKAGVAERVMQGRGYVYFVDGEAHTWHSSSIPVCYMRDLTPEAVLYWHKALSTNS
jgi:hypothetical protein